MQTIIFNGKTINMNQRYYYGLVTDLLLFSNIVEFTKHVDKNFADPIAGFERWYDCGSCHVSMECEYSGI